MSVLVDAQTNCCSQPERFKQYNIFWKHSLLSCWEVWRISSNSSSTNMENITFRVRQVLVYQVKESRLQRSMISCQLLNESATILIITSTFTASQLWMFSCLFPPLWQQTEYCWVLDKTRHLRTSSWALGDTDRHISHFAEQTTNRIIGNKNNR